MCISSPLLFVPFIKMSKYRGESVSFGIRKIYVSQESNLVNIWLKVRYLIILILSYLKMTLIMLASWIRIGRHLIFLTAPPFPFLDVLIHKRVKRPWSPHFMCEKTGAITLSKSNHQGLSSNPSWFFSRRPDC